MGRSNPPTASAGTLHDLLVAAAAAGAALPSTSQATSGAQATTDAKRSDANSVTNNAPTDPNQTALFLSNVFNSPQFLQAFTQATIALSGNAPNANQAPLPTPQPSLPQPQQISSNHYVHPSQIHPALLTDQVYAAQLHGQHSTSLQGTPIQQTRSGRISRPPIQAPVQAFLQSLDMNRTSDGGEYSSVAGASNGDASYWPGHMHMAQQSGTSRVANGTTSKRSKAVTESEGEGDERSSRKRRTKEKVEEVAVPAWPLPPSGPKSRITLGKEEILARRKERNKVSAIRSRRKKDEHLEELEIGIKEKDRECEILQGRVTDLEAEVRSLRDIIKRAGLVLPSQNTPSFFDIPAVQLQPASDSLRIPSFDPMEGMENIANAVPIPSFDAFFNIDDMDGEYDADFQPESSPKHGSDSDDSDVEEDESRRPSRTRKGKQRAGVEAEPEHDQDDDDDEDFLDPEEEDEDLFLPIEDVPVPPVEEATKDAMKALGVETHGQLGAVVQMIIEGAGERELQPEMMEKLKTVLAWTQRGGQL